MFAFLKSLTRRQENPLSRRPLWVEIGDRVRLARQDAGISQAALAEQIGVSRVTIVNLEAGRNRTTLDNLYLIAWECGVSIDALIPCISPPRSKQRKG